MIALDERRDAIIPGNEQKTIQFCVEQFIKIVNQAIKLRGYAAVALSGGNTPKSIYQSLAQPGHCSQVDWSKVLLFWSDERSVPLTHADSNYHMAMQAGFKDFGIPSEQIFPMHAEKEIEHHAREYEELIRTHAPEGKLDLVMLGMGDDGHTASLFPRTHALHANARMTVANFVPQKNTWRMTLTYPGIHQSRQIVFYVFGKSKADMVKKVLLGPYEPDTLPSQKVGTPENKALWILDESASQQLKL